ncbi:MAG: UDP-N-acetylmuramoyl-L-alanine--D-glutamate ligase, partial [Thermodesulfobacteriota bacterium]
MELKDKKILVVGLGKTGQDTARFLIRRGAQVKASDSSTREKLGPVFSEMSSLGVDVEAGIHTDETFLWADLIVLSPGVPFSIPQIKTALKNGTEVISEVELASRFINTPIIAITGSNGKTTTSTLIAKILERNSKKVFLGANIGTPLIQIADTAEQFDILVLELSSFQLQGVTTFRPEIAVILNITPNHLDHHKSFEEYVQSKLKIYSNQSEQDWFIYNGEDIEIISHLNEVKSHQIPFGESNLDGIKYDGSNIIFRDHSYSVSETKLLGAHNIENIMAAIAGTAILGCDPKLIQEAIDHFEPLEHRNEYIGKLGGANVYNDSKSTSPAATQKALESLTPPIILIAGGKDKG